MKSKDLMQQAKNQFAEKFKNALDSGEAQQLAQVFTDYAEQVQNALMEEYLESRNDDAVLASRGIRVLTSEENRYYNALIAAMRNSKASVQQAITDIEVALPETVIDAVLDDIESSFPLLNEIDFRNVTGITKWLYNTQGTQLAEWGPLGSEITKELSGSIAPMNMTQCKLTAYLAVSKDFLDLGPVWIDRYVRAILAEANGLALEKAIVDGDGSVGPIGMTRDLSNGTTDDHKTTYARKKEEKVTIFSPKAYGELLAKLAKTASGRERVIRNVILVVSQSDYLTKVMPATTILTPQGTYVSDVLPFPTKIIVSTGLEAGKAVLGLSKRYFAGIGANKKGFIEYSDHAQFLEDNRVYTTHFYGNGRPLDNNAFLYLDITELEAPLVQVQVVNTQASEAV